MSPRVSCSTEVATLYASQLGDVEGRKGEP